MGGARPVRNWAVIAVAHRYESVLSDVMGRSGRAIIQALIDGETDPAKLAALAHWKVRASAATLREALRDGISALPTSIVVAPKRALSSKTHARKSKKYQTRGRRR